MNKHEDNSHIFYKISLTERVQLDIVSCANCQLAFKN